MSNLDMFSSIVPTLAAVAGAWIAFVGLRTWRDQIKGQASYDVARRALRAVLAVREEIGKLRAPFISVGEITSAFKEAGIDLGGVKIPGDPRIDELVYSRRWEPVRAAMTNLEAEVLEAESFLDHQRATRTVNYGAASLSCCLLSKHISANAQRQRSGERPLQQRRSIFKSCTR